MPMAPGCTPLAAAGNALALDYEAVVDGIADQPPVDADRRDRVPAAQPLLRVRQPRPRPRRASSPG